MYIIIIIFIITIESVDRGRATYLLQQDMCDEDSEKGNLKTTTTTIVSSRTGAHRDRYLANFRK